MKPATKYALNKVLSNAALGFLGIAFLVYLLAATGGQIILWLSTVVVLGLAGSMFYKFYQHSFQYYLREYEEKEKDSDE